MSAAADDRGDIAPRAAYEQRLAAQLEAVARRRVTEGRIGNARLALFALAGLLAWLAFGRDAVPGLSVLVCAAGFAALVMVHDQVIRARRRGERAAEFYRNGLARLDDSWAGTGRSGDRFRDAGHLYVEDLDIFGAGSLFELLCAARTEGGEETLARWLLAPADPDTVRARQAAVAELRPRLDLREELAVLGEEVRGQVRSGLLTDWADAPPARFPAATRGLAFVLAACAVLAALAWPFGAGPLPLLGIALAEAATALAARRGTRAVLRAVDEPTRELRLLSSLLERLERERFESPHLSALRAALDADGEPPSRQIDGLRRLVELADARRNQLFAPVAALLLWGTHFALAIEAWRRRSGPAVGRWLAAVAEIEALSSLAGHTFERPEDVFPELVADGPRFEGEGLGHPLLPTSRCVRNDVTLSSERALLVVSGSNMSGKSTLLRTVGTNLVLALAGAPVRATRLRLSPLHVGATTRVLDSLQQGTSHFYAELTRIRDIVEAAESRPVLFLLDEIFHGTNSHDRRVGAEAIVRALVSRNAIGLVTTHDLALAKVADALAPRAANVHFEDQLVGGEMHFDYRMRPGVVERSNALALMRAVGLEV